ncbi:MAG: PAS domain-containing protein [Bacteroidales bacterium]|nr:PAS domain-containing protein [Bacteroidales bacterium]
MNHINWAEELGVAVTVSDTEGKIVYMNRKSATVFSNYGGPALVGRNLKVIYFCLNP